MCLFNIVFKVESKWDPPKFPARSSATQTVHTLSQTIHTPSSVYINPHTHNLDIQQH